MLKPKRVKRPVPVDYLSQRHVLTVSAGDHLEWDTAIDPVSKHEVITAIRLLKGAEVFPVTSSVTRTQGTSGEYFLLHIIGKNDNSQFQKLELAMHLKDATQLYDQLKAALERRPWRCNTCHCTS